MNYDDKTWECPRCGQRMTAPATIRQCICACPGTQAYPLFGQTDMIDITPRRQPGELMVVPDDMSGLLLEWLSERIPQ